jgi:hypothetical protein
MAAGPSIWGVASTREPSGANAAPAPFAAHELNQLRAAARHAMRVFPGPVGELLARELDAHADFGYRFGGSGLLQGVAREVLAMPRSS